MKTLGNRILIRLDPPAQNAIALPDSATKLSDTGVVLQLGTGHAIDDAIQPGQRVRVDNSYNSVETTFDGVKARIYSVRDVLAILG